MIRSPRTASTLTIADAQRDMRQAYLGGGPGVLVSGTAWFAAALSCLFQSPQQAVWTLFFGGMLIHPLAVLLLKALGRSGQHVKGNPLAGLAMAGTFWMILSLPLAYLASQVRIEWFFPAMLLVIGGRYFTFATLYGTRFYWAMGVVLVLAGWWLFSRQAAPVTGAFAGAAIEAVFALAIIASERARTKALA